MNHLNHHTSILLSTSTSGQEKDALTWLFSQVDQLKKLTNASPNLQPINQPGETITIEAIRSLSLDLAHFGLSDGLRVFILNTAENMTLPAQHALLKSLEEPPEQVQIILITEQPNQLLATIRSRCQHYTFPGDSLSSINTNEQPKYDLPQIMTMSYPDLISLAEQLKDRDQAKNWLKQQLAAWVTTVEADPNLNSVRALRALETAIRDLAQNGNVKLGLEHCFFTIKQLKTTHS